MGALALIGAGLGIAQGVKNLFSGDNSRQAQLEQQMALQNQQIEGGKELARFRQSLDIDTWKRTNAAAQMEQYKEAGLNPALIYGGSGGGGSATTGNNAPLPTAATAESPSIKRQTDAQLALLGAQIANLDSQTKKNNAEAEATSGIKTEEGRQNIKESKGKQALMDAQQKFTEIETKFAKESIEYRLDKVAQEANIALGMAQSAGAKGEIDTRYDVINARIQEIKNAATESAVKIAAQESGIKLNNARISEITNGIAQKWQELNISATKSRYEHSDRIKAIEEYTANALKVAGIQAATNVIRDVVAIATKSTPKGSISTTTDEMGNVQKETYTRPN